MENLINKKHSVVYNSPRGIPIEVIIDDTTSWLSQSQIAELFCIGRSTTTKQINTTISSNGMSKSEVCSILEHTAADGKVYSTQFYNLDIILFIGYRYDLKTAQDFRKFCEVEIAKEIAKRNNRRNARNAFLWFERVSKSTITYCNEFLKLTKGHENVTKDAIKDYMSLIIKLRNECYSDDEINRISESKSVFPKEIRGYLCHEGNKPIFQPNHLMCKLATLRDEVNHINYEFLIEYDIFDPSTEIYYGVKAVSDEPVSSNHFIECAEKIWGDVLGRNIKMKNKDKRGRPSFYIKYENRFKETDNGNNGTFWPFWIRYDADKESFVDVVTALKTVFKDFGKSLNNILDYKGEFQNIENILKNNVCYNKDTYRAVVDELDSDIRIQLKEESVNEFKEIVLPNLEEKGLIKKREDGLYQLKPPLKELASYMEVAFKEMKKNRIKDKYQNKELNSNLPISALQEFIRNGGGNPTNGNTWSNRIKLNEERYEEIEKDVRNWFS
ncbi:MAG: virulence RhuM family protein [Bacteroidales bacterium]|nr:virulence RhuM family protein [Bacteroidales bacterium]